MPTLYSILLCGGVLFAAALIYVGLHLLRRARRPADERVPRNGSDWERSGSRVLWDVRGRTAKPLVRDGVLYIDRRSALVRGLRSVLAIVGIVAVGRSAGAASDLLQGDGKKRIADDSAGHVDVPSIHSDSGEHSDSTPHVDIPDPYGDKASHTDVAKHQDVPHTDQSTIHTDSPNG